jgi:NADH dehydrogenase [ubiquinone] 1 alpha subcomplex assembly factor 7
MGAQRKLSAQLESPLAARLRESIARHGPISVHNYMQACLADARGGYYLTRQPIGRDGDFVTAPEISQVFGELLGVWIASVWHAMGEPAAIVAELGPGRGTLTGDALRVFAKAPRMLANIRVALVETSPVLREGQRALLSGTPIHVEWYDRVEDLPKGPLILIANEFIDALPVRQFVRQPGAWHERCVALGEDGSFTFSAGAPLAASALPRDLGEADDGAIFETRPAVPALVAHLAARASEAPVSALFVDYGHAETGFGDTLQAVRQHRFADPLALPGEADLTAHVDFAALKATAETHGLDAYGPMPQGEFLLRLGLELRCERLSHHATAEQQAAIKAGAARLADPRQMGVLFKMLALQSSGLAPPPPFGDI